MSARLNYLRSAAKDAGVNNWIFSIWKAGSESLISIQCEWSVDDIVAAYAFLELDGALIDESMKRSS